jgi:predicted lipid-binding transport protein (Tim44 family)
VLSSIVTSGLVAATETFDEIWHLEKPLDGASGWLISGIPQA